jgi:hypothetical protein
MRPRLTQPATQVDLMNASNVVALIDSVMVGGVVPRRHTS